MEKQKITNLSDNNPTFSGQQMSLSGLNESTHYDYVLRWSNSDLNIMGAPNKKLERALTYTKKSLDWDPKTHSRKTTFSQEKVYNKTLLNTGGTLVCYQTLQGLLDRVYKLLTNQGLSCKIEDLRIPLNEKPQLQLMHGFRFDQKELLEKALLKQRSGLIAAPTRYGKTVLITNTANAYPNLKTVILAPGVDLLPQLVEAIKKYCPNRDVKGIFTGSKDRVESDDITVCSFDSMHKLDKSSYKLVLIDAPHASVADSRAPQLVEFNNALILGYGATVEGRWQGNDILIEGIIGPILSETTYKKCVEIGALCPIHVYLLKIPYRPLHYKTRNAAYNAYLFNNKKFHETVGSICNDVIPKEWQTLIFIDNEKEACALRPFINDGVLAMDKLMKNKVERQKMFADLKADKVKRCICSNIYSTGVTIDNLKCEINCDDGGGSILSVQKPGRLAEIKPGKKEGVMIDFLFVPDPAIEDPTSFDLLINKDSFNRLLVYQNKGYNITICDSLEEMKSKILENNNYLNKSDNN